MVSGGMVPCQLAIGMKKARSSILDLAVEMQAVMEMATQFFAMKTQLATFVQMALMTIKMV